jgi:deazaflavin-dependent oxidoreductase (nitroreductase family)
MATLESRRTGECKEWLRRFNRKITNPIMLSFAGKQLYTVVEHVGRRSKRVYHTPVLGQPGGEGFFIPLPYGEDTDWCRNVLAAGGCTVRWNGQTIQLTRPQIVGREVGEAVYPRLYRWLLQSAKVQKYLYANYRKLLLK